MKETERKRKKTSTTSTFSNFFFLNLTYMRKKLAGLLAPLLLLSGSASAQDGTRIYDKNYQILQGIVWDTKQWSNYLDAMIKQKLAALGTLHFGVAEIPIGQILVNVWDGISCQVPAFSGQMDGLEKRLPTRISVRLPCKTVWVDFTPEWTKVVNEVTTSINSVLPDWFEKCVHNPTDPQCAKTAYWKVIKAYNSFNTMRVEGEGLKEYSEKTNEELNEEVKKDGKSLSQDVLPVATKGEVNAYNAPVLKANLGTMKEAGNSIGKLPYPERSQVESLPEDAKALYAFVVKKQVAREKVIQAFQNRIDALFQELFALKQAIDSYCQTPVKGVEVLPPSIGGIVGADLESLKEVAIKRGCCCCDAIPAIKSAKSAVLSRIAAAEANVVTAIEKAALQVSKTISTEAYRTRVQIHNEFMNLQANEKTYRCMTVKLEYLKLKTQIYDLMMQLAQLETMYANLSNAEKAEMKKQLDEIFQQAK